jgi:hypothetical protein
MKHLIRNVGMMFCHTVLWHRPPKYGMDNLKDKTLTAVDQHTTLIAYRNCWQEKGVGHAKNLSTHHTACLQELLAGNRCWSCQELIRHIGTGALTTNWG